MSTIALAMIAGGEDPVGDGLEPAILSARDHVDEVAVWANGPETDHVVDIAACLNAQEGAPIVVEQGTWTDDFSAARNASFAMTGADWIVSLDCNDELVGGERLREIVTRADDAQADIAWVYWDRYANDRHGWWPSVVRAGTGRWQGVVHECWRHLGIDRWRHGVGQPGSVHVHPAALRVFHRDRLDMRFKYLGLLHKAAEDPERTPWALAALAEELRRIDDKRAVELFEQHLAGGFDKVEGTWNALHASTLENLWKINARLGNVAAAERYRREWDAYTRKVTKAMGADAALVLQLGDEAQVAAWAAMSPDDVDVLLDASPVVSAGAAPKVGRNDLCWCGSGRKFKRCHGA